MKKLALIATLALATLGAHAAPPVTTLLPESTFLVAGTPNWTAMREGIERSPLGGLWEEPSIRAFLRPLTEDFGSEFGLTGTDSVISVDEFNRLFPGQIYVGIQRFSLVNGAPDIAPFFVAETSQPERVLEIVDTLLERAGAQQQRDTYAVQDVTVQRNALRIGADSDIPGMETQTDPFTGTKQGSSGAMSERAFTLHTAVSDGLVMMSIDQPLEAVISNLRGGGDGGLAASEVTQRAANLIGNPQGDLVFQMNFAPVDQMIRSSPDTQQYFNAAALGIGDFETLNLVVDFGPDSTENWTALTLKPNPTGLGRLLRHAHAGEYSALDWVPANVASVSGLGYDIPAAYNDFKMILMNASPMMGMMISSGLMSANSSLGFDVENDLIRSLGDEFVTYTPLPAEGAEGEVSPSVMIFSLSNPTGLESVFARLSAEPVVGSTQVSGQTQALIRKEFLGQPFYTPPPVFNDPDMAAQLPAFAVVGGQLVFSTSVPELQSVIAASQGQIEQSVRGSALWNRLGPVQMEGATGFSYQDDAAVMANVSTSLEQMAMMFVMMPEFAPPLDFSRVPEPEVFERHLTHTVSSTRIDERGLVSHGRSPHSE
jgi:hypothetical protein